MAEAVFCHLTSHPPHPLIGAIDSAGTAAYHVGSDPDRRTMRTLSNNDIRDYSHAARKVTAEDFNTFDWIFAMDSDNLSDLRSMRDRSQRRKRRSEDAVGSKDARIMLFGDWGGRKGEEVIDPYYGADNGFDVAYEQMVRFTKGFIKHLESEEGDQSES